MVINQLLYLRAPSSAARRCCKWLDDNEISSSDVPLFPGFAHCVRTSRPALRTFRISSLALRHPVLSGICSLRSHIPHRLRRDLLSRYAPFHIPIPLAGAAFATKEGSKLTLLFLYAGRPYDSKLSTDSLHTKTG